MKSTWYRTLPAGTYHPAALAGVAATWLALSVSAAPVSVFAPILWRPTADRAAQYSAQTAKSVIALQQFRTRQTAPITRADGQTGTATLVSLNPNVGAWYLLTLRWADGKSATYHLENSSPRQDTLSLDTNAPGGLVFTRGPAASYTCAPWSTTPSALAQARTSRLPYAPLCGGRLALRNRVSGRRTNLELATEILRKNVWGGDRIVNFVKQNFYVDAFLYKAKLIPADNAVAVPAVQGPSPAKLGKRYLARSVRARNLGIAIGKSNKKGLALGQWYPAKGLKGVSVGVMLPGAVSREILLSHPEHVNHLDRIESGALVYLVAFDLSRFTFGWERGTTHPGVEWSPRPPYNVRPRGMPGPDGFKTIAPLVTTGMLNPRLAGRVVATFTGGFKRSHGAFRYGDMAQSWGGHHYGFVENGVILSKLLPGLSTLYVLTDGSLHMKTWSEADNTLLPVIVTARQNGVPLVERDPATGQSLPGPRVNQWGGGNWSGSAKAQLRTLRAGACMMDNGPRRYLVYAIFSTATPSAMAQVFRAYGCKYAMLLDMNAPVLTYMATYTRKAGSIIVGHLIKSMAGEDKRRRGRIVPRFLGFPDNRDFFYILSRKGAP